MQQTLARRAAKDASPRLPSTSGSSSESDEAFLVAGTPFLPFVSTRGQPGLNGSNIKGLVLFDVASGKLRIILSSPEKAREAKASPGAQKASCAAQSSSAAAGSVCLVSSR